MSSGLYSGVSGLALGTGLYKGVSGLWSGSSGLITGWGVGLSLDFLTGTLDPRITFSRTTNATLADATGRVTYAPNNQVTYSEQFDNAAWTKTNSTITANATTAPDGTLTADKHIPNNGATIGVGASETRVFQSPSATISVNYVYSIYAKAGEYDEIQFAAIATPTVTARFSLTLGTVISGAGATITSVGDGWYRCALPVVAGATATLALRWSAYSSTVSVGDGTSGIFVWGSQFEAVTYQTVPSAYVQTVASVYYGPRFDYNPATLASLGLLIEEQRVNLALYSDQFDNAGWGKALSTVTTNATTSPDGTSNADKLIPTAVAGEHYARQTLAVSAGSSITTTIYVKAAEYRSVRMRCLDAAIPANGFQGSVDTSTGATLGTVAGAGTFTSVSATSVGNGWWRLAVTGSAGASATSIVFDVFVLPGDQSSSSSFTGDGTSGLFLWGAQFEVGAFATSYIPTVASTVTRAADIATMTGTNFSDWYNQSEGTIVASVDTFAPSASTILSFQDGAGSSNNRNQMNVYTSFSATVVGGVVQANMGTNISTSPTLAYAYKANDFAACVNGAAVATDTSGTVPTTLAYATLGKWDFGTAASLNGHLRTITYYPQRLTNGQLQELTAPRLVASLDLNFLTGAPLDSRITFTRSTTATFVGSNGLIQSAAIDTPRFDYNPATLAPLGLLIEEQRVNLTLYSEQFDNAAWGKALSTVTANATTSPDGTANADKITPTAVAGEHYARQTIAISAGATITVSIYVKADGYRSVRMRCLDAAIPANGFQGSVDTSTGANGGSVAGAGTFTSASATSVGNGWWRLTVTGNAGATAASIIFDVFVLPGDQNSASSFTGDGVSSLFLWGAQFEVGAFATSYIPTVASTVTRTADNAAITGANFASWYNAGDGSIVFSGDSVRTGVSPATRSFQFDDGTSANNIRAAGASTLQVVEATVAVVNIAGVPLIPFDGTVYKFASAYKLNDFATVTTGAVVTDTSGTVPTVTRLALGGDVGGGNLCGHIRSITYYPQRLLDTQLQVLSG